MINSNKSVSIIIRTKNEAKWINSCLKAVKKQEFDQKKIQIIVLDNNSFDGTIDIVKKFDVKLIKYNPPIYLPGHALNHAVKKAKNEIVVFLSAHCIPTSNKWLKKLINSFEEETAAVYGKQLPYSFSSFKDKRDLFNQFGLERRIEYGAVTEVTSSTESSPPLKILITSTILSIVPTTFSSILSRPTLT